ncbi:MAG: PHP domain-containing protein [Candidatus Omnitrophica bacterium]|nr:PHP domain-containing protein [Candidatus Omnitrophota bacterium]MDD3274133.1 PHP domain-containing protein [Candidatus Omnitrophota bacterium]MDD5077831.1 PHP domain-containing protein [Candidatus Omnitrophota bacterium]MDD5724524.1 PHP domain-containing protein [Candidatus Omnitrophota bacterium]
MKFADLHIHTLHSDGTFTPGQLVKEALARGISALAVTDHDTTEGVGESLSASSGTGLEVIPGIELTAQHENREVHVLGYFIDYRDERLLEKLKQVRLNRRERVYKIIGNLEGMGIKLDPETVFGIAGKATVGRMHIARAMVKDGLVSSTAEAFRKYIGDKSPAYVLGFRISVPEAIGMIKAAGGRAVLAHPYLLDDDDLIGEFARCGLDGLEVYYPEHSQSMVNFYLDLAKKFGLLVTGGTDFHGSAKPQIKLGMIKVPLELVEELRRGKR